MQSTEYYRFLAATLGPAQLGRAALRRLRRDTVRRLVHLPRPKVEHPAQAARHIVGGHVGRGPLEPDDFPAAREIAASTLSWYAAEAHASADRVLAGDLFLFGAWRGHARGELARGIASVDWTRDPLGGARAPDLPSDRLDPNHPRSDARSIWEAGRLAHVLWLAVADALPAPREAAKSRAASDPGIHARAAVAHVRDFAATQPVGHGIHWTCAMEAGLRVIHVSLALDLLRRAPEADALFWIEAARLLSDHADYLATELEDGRAVPNNHLLAGLAGLAVAGSLWPGVPAAEKRRSHALRDFAEALLDQTAPDGLAFEASLPYHRFATELGLVVEACARRAGATLGGAALDRLWRMVDVAEDATLPDGLLANVGDNDSSRAFAYRPRTPLETPHLAAIRTALGGPGNPGQIEPEALFLCGIRGFRLLVARAPGRNDPQPMMVDGLAVLRSGGRAVTLRAGGNGQKGLGGHAHNDKLSTEIVLNRRRFVVDPGCPVYAADAKERDRFRSTLSHPVLCVDGEEQSPIPRGRPFLLPDRARARLLELDLGPAGARASGEHAAYARLRPPVLLRREVVLPEGGGPAGRCVLVTDRLSGGGGHVVEVRWPSPLPGALVRGAYIEEIRSLRALEELPCGEGAFDAERVIAWPTGPDGPGALLAIACTQPFEVSVEGSIWSPGWGERRPGCTVRVRLHARLPLSVTSAFLADSSR